MAAAAAPAPWGARCGKMAAAAAGWAVAACGARAALGARRVRAALGRAASGSAGTDAVLRERLQRHQVGPRRG